MCAHILKDEYGTGFKELRRMKRSAVHTRDYVSEDLSNTAFRIWTDGGCEKRML